MGYNNISFPPNSVFLVTGGAGFIGSNICEAILSLGYKVRCLDNLSTGKKQNIDLLVNNSDFSFIYGDIIDFRTCLKACEGVDYVLNQAAWGSVPRSLELPLSYCSNNIMGTINMMEAARQTGIKKFIYASSSSVYGDATNLPKTEGNEGDLLSPYAVSKRCDEEWGKQYYKYFNLDTYGLRYFNVFGPRQDSEGEYSAVIPRFIKQILSGESSVINGDGKQSRDFTYIENVIEANLKACLAPHEVAGEVYNIAYGEEKSIIDVYCTLTNVLGTNIEPKFGPERRCEPKRSVADISKAKKLLGYDPDWSFESGIKVTVEWYNKYLGHT